jgi:ElaB/YqjD/DUF883 family membrane-anchored ribosome-binding protein
METTEQATKELYSALKETMATIEKAFGSSALMQTAKYQAINNKVKNWYFNATEALEKYKP